MTTIIRCHTILHFAVVMSTLCLALTCPRVTAADSNFVIEDCVFLAQHDNTEQAYVLMVPKAWDQSMPISILIALHGHGSDRWQFVRQPRDECRAVREVAAENGMLIVAPDYRASTSWMGPAAEADVVQLVQQLKIRFPVDRVIVCGGSMGGTAALTFTAIHPDLVDGVVAINGTANLVDYERFQDAIAQSFGGTKQEVPDQYRKRSAKFAPERFTMPLAATTGGKDEVVPCSSTLRLLKKVSEHNKDVLSIHRPNGGHSTNLADTRKALEFVLKASAADGK